MDCPTVNCPSCSKQVRVCETRNYNGRCEDCWIGGYMSMSEYTPLAFPQGITLQQAEEIEEWNETDRVGMRRRKGRPVRYDLTRLPQKYKHSLRDDHEEVLDTSEDDSVVYKSNLVMAKKKGEFVYRNKYKKESNDE